MGTVPRAAVIVAHPDDETLWCGGLMLQHPHWDWSVFTLCRRSDAERALRFARVLRFLGAEGSMGDLDDGPDQVPLDSELVRRTIADALPAHNYEVVLTHGPRGEYTRNRRHEECSQAVVSLWLEGAIQTRELRLFAYGDHNGRTLPVASPDAELRVALSADIFARKYHIITELYGFQKHTWEAQTTPSTEAFDRVPNPPLPLHQTQPKNASHLQ